MTPEEAYKKASQLLSSHGGPNSTPESRRVLFEHLLTLPAYPSYSCKQQFGTFIHKYFAEFEDLQDPAVDAILDLCEDDDEKVRIVGIKGLGNTGRADPRWVRGNTGVLLQLLECPPAELRYVREALHTLLTVSPSDVLSVMADDCRASEQETGASRRNVVDFLERGAADQRRDILDSGNNLAAEKTFMDGFGDLLPALPTSEKMSVLRMLTSLSTVGGKNASEETAAWFAKRAVESVPANSSKDTTRLLIEVFERWTGAAAVKLDGRYGLLFFSLHGRKAVAMAIEGREEGARKLVERLRGWVGDAMKRWESGKGKEGDGELKEEKLVVGLSRAVVTALVDLFNAVPKTFSEATLPSTETLIYSVYKLLSHKDRRSEVVRGTESRGLQALSRFAEQEEKAAREGSSGRRAWGGVRSMCGILANPDAKFVQIFPSWEPVPLGPSHAIPRGPRVPPAGPSSQRQQPRPLRDEPPHRPAPSGTARPAAPARLRNDPPASAPSGPSARSRHPMAKLRSPSPPRASASAAPAAPSRHVPAKRSASPPVAPSAGSQAGKELLGPPSRAQPANRPAATSDRASVLPARRDILPSGPARPGATSQRPQSPALPPKTSEPVTPASGSPQVTATTASSTSTPPLSLAQRLAPRTASASKRPREENAAATSTELEKPSLLSRLSARDQDEREAKRPRESEVVDAARGTPSLLSRLARHDIGSTATLPDRQIAEERGGSSETATPTAASGLSILNRSRPTPPPAPPAPSTQATPSGLSIRRAPPAPSTAPPASQPQPARTISVLGRSSAPSTPANGEEGVRRKGRGFSKDHEEDQIIVPPRHGEGLGSEARNGAARAEGSPGGFALRGMGLAFGARGVGGRGGRGR